MKQLPATTQKPIALLLAVGRRSCGAARPDTTGTARREPRPACALPLALLLCASAQGQINTGSDGHDGAFNPTTNTVINMADHPDGIYQYTSVNIPSGVTVTFIPNANNTPVVWLVQSNVVISGTIDATGKGQPYTAIGGVGGPGGWAGGSGGTNPTPGQGPGGGSSNSTGNPAGGGSFGSLGSGNAPGPIYGSAFLVPLLGGSGGGGATAAYGAGGGGGGAILIACSGTISVNGAVQAYGGSAGVPAKGGCGSGGGIRLVASTLTGTGWVNASRGGSGSNLVQGGDGRVRFDTFLNSFSGSIQGIFTQGSQFVLSPAPNQGVALIVTSVGGVPVSASPTGQLATPDAILSAQQNNPMPIVVHCSNIPLSTQITVSVKPANGPAGSAIGYNNTGTVSSSTATVLLNMPRGGGLIYATAATSL